MITHYTLLSPELHEDVQRGAVGIIPTDTKYSLIAHAQMPQAVERVYKIKGRDPLEPSVMLVSSPERVADFGVPHFYINLVRDYWPGALSVIFEGIPDKFRHLHRGTKTLGFRVPSHPALRYFLERTGPIIAPSASKATQPTIATSIEAELAFGQMIDFFVDGGQFGAMTTPTIVKVNPEGQVQVLRQGAVLLG